MLQGTLKIEQHLSDVFSYARPKIDERNLNECLFHNIPIDIAKQIMVAKININRDKEIMDLEKRLGNLE